MSEKNVLTNFENIDNEEKAYWLGFLCADGSVGSKEDKIEKMRYISVLDFAALGVDDESLIESVIAQLAGIYEGMEGVTYEHELTDGVLTEKTSIEIAKTTLDDLIQIGVVGEDTQSIDIKLSEMTENFTSQGFECK